MLRVTVCAVITSGSCSNETISPLVPAGIFFASAGKLRQPMRKAIDKYQYISNYTAHLNRNQKSFVRSDHKASILIHFHPVIFLIASSDKNKLFIELIYDSLRSRKYVITLQNRLN